MRDPNLRPIGFIRTREDQSAKGKEATSEIVIKEELTEALDGIEQFSHMFVLYLFHLADETDRTVLKAPMTDEQIEDELKQIFAQSGLALVPIN